MHHSTSTSELGSRVPLEGRPPKSLGYLLLSKTQLLVPPTRRGGKRAEGRSRGRGAGQGGAELQRLACQARHFLCRLLQNEGVTLPGAFACGEERSVQEGTPKRPGGRGVTSQEPQATAAGSWTAAPGNPRLVRHAPCPATCRAPATQKRVLAFAAMASEARETCSLLRQAELPQSP